MPSPAHPPPPSAGDELARLARRKTHGLVRELWDLVRHNKKYWLVPILVALLVVGALVVIATSAGPAIYTLS
ncbi:MAG TPA: DUF5989 family protein [Thermoanaerobaculia bacterium]|nr:DUF5989 family protein [Thermoanaerobaculia bacterium]